MTANKEHITDFENFSEEDLALSAEELKKKLESMRKLLASQEARRNAERGSCKKESIIDGSFLSAVFGVVFILIVGVSIHAFTNLYRAIVKKFTHVHTEL